MTQDYVDGYAKGFTDGWNKQKKRIILLIDSLASFIDGRNSLWIDKDILLSEINNETEEDLEGEKDE